MWDEKLVGICKIQHLDDGKVNGSFGERNGGRNSPCFGAN
jgi:hypothetical protein